jgi:glutamate N-acetyltransferase/amino-acid N-acetyltransferase
MNGKKVIFELNLHSGEETATAWGCDLTEDYVKINGRYTT